MLEHEDKFEEEFSNWAKAVLNLQNVRDGSISYIKHKMEPFIDELIHMHAPDEEEHFKELLIKVAVNGEVKQEKSKKNTKAPSWALYDKKCTKCENIFQRILNNFKESYLYRRWERHASKDTISPTNYWWIVSKLYISHKCDIETSLGPEEVEPFAVLSLMSRCKLFHGNLLWFDVGQVILSRHELMHSINNRLSDVNRDKYLLEMKTLIKNVAVDTSTTEVLKAFEEVENLTVALFTEDGEIHQLANKALQLQNHCLNANFKSPEGVHATIKSLAMYKIETKSQELKLRYKDQLEKQQYELQKKMDELERNLQHETEKNKTYEDNLRELKISMENKFRDLQQEKHKQYDELSSFKSKMDDKFKDLQLEKSKKDDKISSLIRKMMDDISVLKQETTKQDDKSSSLKTRKSTNHIYEVQSFSDVNVRVDSDKKTCFISDMCQMVDGTVILLDYKNHKMKILDDIFDVKDFYQFIETPLCIAPMSSSQVAVLYTNSNIDLLLLDENIVVEKRIILEGLSGELSGMIHCNNQFWIRCSNGLCIYSSSGTLMKRMESLSLDQHLPYVVPCTICSNKDKTRVFVMKANTIYVLDTDGEVLFTFILRDVASIISITIDNILMISHFISGNIDMYNIEGRKLGTLIPGTDMLPGPLSMLYDGKKCCLIIGFRWEEKLRGFQLKMI